VKLLIVIPPKPTDKEKELFQELAMASHFDPRELIAGGR
jgi:hypothetical protein